MRLAVLFCFLFVGLVIAAEQNNQLPRAEGCDEELCKLPDCRCSSTNIPGGLLPRDTPQFVTITFDDGVNVQNIETYREILYGRKNSNGCPAGTTFYINHEYTNYQFVNELYNQGFEIALHSITHQTPQSYWAAATYDVMKEEIADQRVQMSHFANIPLDSIQGVRLPFLQMNGNASFHVMADYGLVYDCSWPTIAYTNPGLWPYSLDYASTQDCIVPPCPTASIPKSWVLPMVSWSDLNGVPCSMVDTCFFIPDLEDDEEGWYRFIVSNFERHYLGNRAPFGFFVHEWYIASYPAVKAALIRFMNLVNNLSDAFMVNSSEVIDWVKDPIPVPEYRAKSCKQWQPMSCPASSCTLTAEHNQMEYWLQLCNVCPRTYPWLGNPLGL